LTEENKAFEAKLKKVKNRERIHYELNKKILVGRKDSNE
jgi:hypothetical protein